jgi:DNA-binding transcriptional LysR family regulator
LRIAAPPIVLHDYVPELLRRVRRRFPILRLELHEAARADAERLLQAGEVDLAITVIGNKRRSEIHSRPLLELPLILLVNKKHHLTSAKQL